MVLCCVDMSASGMLLSRSHKGESDLNSLHKRALKTLEIQSAHIQTFFVQNAEPVQKFKCQKTYGTHLIYMQNYPILTVTMSLHLILACKSKFSCGTFFFFYHPTIESILTH